jgi:hypothetical protein
MLRVKSLAELQAGELLLHPPDPPHPRQASVFELGAETPNALP